MRRGGSRLCDYAEPGVRFYPVFLMPRRLPRRDQGSLVAISLHDRSSHSGVAMDLSEKLTVRGLVAGSSLDFRPCRLHARVR